MSRLDFLLNNLVAAVERRDRLADIERERMDDYMLRPRKMMNRNAYGSAIRARRDAEHSVLSIAVDVADHVRDRKAKMRRATDGADQ